MNIVPSQVSFKHRIANSVALKRNPTTKATAEEIKTQLLERVSKLELGRAASEKDRSDVDDLCKQLETIAPSPKSIEQPEINGKWELLYTTAPGILRLEQPGFLRPKAPIYQCIDTENLRALNMEGPPFWSTAHAALKPLSPQRVQVQFQKFKICNILPIKAPEGAGGWIDITYLDDSMRVTRGSKGNLFVLKQADKNVRVTGDE